MVALSVDEGVDNDLRSKQKEIASSFPQSLKVWLRDVLLFFNDHPPGEFSRTGKLSPFC